MRIRIGPGLYTNASLDSPQMEEIREAWARNPLLHYFPQKPQMAFHAAIGRHVPIVAFFGGNQSGKTHCSIADDLIQALDASAIPDHLIAYKRWQPPFHAWICCPKNKKLNEAILPKIRELCPPAAFKGGSFSDAFSKQEAFLEFANGSTFGFKTYDQDVDAYSSATLHRIHWDEEPPGEHGYEIRKEARARLLKHGGDEVLSMTPLLGLSWVYEKVYERWEMGDDRIFCVRADMDDNEYLSEDFKQQFLADLTQEERDARKSGKFVHFRGLVYPEWDEKRHVIDPVKPSHVKRMDTVVGIDPGYRTTAVAFCAFDDDNHLLVYDELYLHEEDAIPENAAKIIKAKVKAWGVDPMYIIDPSARNREIVTGKRVAQAYKNAGIPVLPGQADVEVGVFEVRRRLQHKDAQDELNPIMHVTRNCRVFQWEIGRYRMDDRADGVFKVVKENDHIMDAVRYVAMTRPIGLGRVAPLPQPYRFEEGIAPPLEVMQTIPVNFDWDA